MRISEQQIVRAGVVMARSLPGQRSVDQLLSMGVKLGADAYEELSRYWMQKIRSAGNENEFDLTVMAEPLPLDFIGRMGNGMNAAMLMCANAGHKEVIARRRRLTPPTPPKRSLEGNLQARSSFGPIGANYEDYQGSNAELDAFNLRAFTIAHVENESVLAQIKASLADILSGGGSYGEFRQAAKSLLDNQIITEAHLNTVYRMNLQTAYNAGKWSEQQEAIDVLPYIEYVTAGDDRVRPEHLALEGFIARKDDKRWDSIYPPNDWGCRCSTVEHDDFSLKQEGKRLSSGSVNIVDAVGEGFRNNPGLILEQVSAMIRESGLDQKNPADYGMGTMAVRQLGKPMPVPMKEHAAVILDYNGVPRTVNEMGGIDVQEVRAVIVNPEEVWGWPNRNTVYMKRFEAGTVVVEMDGETSKVYRIGDPEELRRGMLMYRGR
jgi:SPP1 gp7 family putative phage head morphogenesis protein